MPGLITDLLEELVREDQHQALFDRLVGLARAFLDANRDRIHTAVRERSVWWLSPAVDQKIAETIVGAVQEFLDNLASLHHPVRVHFDQKVRTTLADLRTSPSYRDKINRVVGCLLEDETVRLYMVDLWAEIWHGVTADVTAEDSRLEAVVAQGIGNLALALGENAVMRAHLNRQIETVVFAIPWQAGVGQFVAEVV
ncbi:MAG: hypothetical protein FD153_281 [Rhodospirillaceae bacterium]|nr:MAG: hypothetical protein FD153_281 [Rhodospirillaceae bacterium]